MISRQSVGDLKPLQLLVKKSVHKSTQIRANKTRRNWIGLATKAGSQSKPHGFTLAFLLRGFAD
jgi:hypothetical protein